MLRRDYELDEGADRVVVANDDEIVGDGTLIASSPARGELVRISVAPAYRGRGVGRSIVASLAARAAARGMSELVMRVDTRWESAIGLCRACGFTEVARDDADTHLHMELDATSLRHVAAVGAGERGYTDPSTGLFVMTAWFLASRPCCGNGCRHCPWGSR